jgi:tRNA pseudouridine38-40 synthase
VLAYEGSGLRGFAAQAGVPTVAGELAEAIARSTRLTGPPVIVCAGRTDAGVHATGQVAHLDLPADFQGDLARAVNRQLAPRIVVRDAEPVDDDFDARRSATSRHYRYLVSNAPVPDPLLAGLAWHVPEPLDLKAMAAATDPLLGEHDFRAFCRRPPGRPAAEPILRRVTDAGWRAVRATWLSATGAEGAEAEDERSPLLRFDVVAGSFCHQMVRSIVAVLVDAGRGKATAATVMELLASASRAGSPQPAPAHGLCLVEVRYDSGAG